MKYTPANIKKAIASAAAAAGAMAVALTNTAGLPPEWISGLSALTGLVVAAATFLAPTNKVTPEQVDKVVKDVGVDVVEEAIAKASGSIPRPRTVRPAASIGQVEQVLRDFRNRSQ